jgi:ketosteroid isomerase-like protein
MRHLRLLFAFSLILPFLLPTRCAQAQEAAKAASVPPEVAAMQKIENTWSDALVKHDQFALELVLAPSFVDISAAGDVTTRNQQISHLLVSETAPVSLEQKVASVRTFGDLAVVNGTYILRKRSNGQAVDEKGIFSHIFQRVRTNWQCINSQRTIVVEQALSAQQKKKQTRSSAEFPFHIPLLHEGAKSNQPAQEQQQQPQSETVPLPH